MDEEEIRSIYAAARTVTLPSSTFPEEQCLEVVNLLQKTVKLMPPAVLGTFMSPALIEAVLRLTYADSFSAQLAATTLCLTLLPRVDPKLVEVSIYEGAFIYGC